ncbi:MAG TPA: DUF5931 domain-containing protein [Actinocrinis sp.]
MPLWRSLAVFRFAAVAFAALVALNESAHFDHPLGAAAILLAMALWTVFTSFEFRRRGGPRGVLLVADLAITCACLLGTRLVVPSDDIAFTVPMVWIAGPVISWAVALGRWAAGCAALVISACSVVVRSGIDLTGVTEAGLLLLAGTATGHLVILTARAEQRVQQAAEAQASARERTRLARGIHDSVLQVLALVERRGAEIGGEAAELGRLAGEQGAALRALVVAEAEAAPEAGGWEDLTGALARAAGAAVSFAAPADPVRLPAPAVAEVAAAVAAALDNVARHVGAEAKAWLLLEDEGDHVVVTVRDEGPGIAPGRLAEAAAGGRLGVASSIRGRIEDLGGAVEISSIPGQGTEIEMRVPRR